MFVKVIALPKSDQLKTLDGWLGEERLAMDADPVPVRRHGNTQIQTLQVSS